MDSRRLAEVFGDLSTPILADAGLRVGHRVRFAPAGIQGLPVGSRVAGRVAPAQHTGSVDVFLDAIGGCLPGDVLVIDNQGRRDEGCIGDLVVLEAQTSGLAGVVVWGSVRDTPELIRIGLPVFSYGAWPSGPVRLDPRSPDSLVLARFGEFHVSGEDAVFGDADGVVFVHGAEVETLLEAAAGIRETERNQSNQITAGTSLRRQLAFEEYLAARAADPAYTFRQHLRRIGGAIEE